MERLSILTLNIWNRQGSWDDRLPVIRAGIEELSPDIIGLQEVLAMGDANQAQAIAKDLEGPEYHVSYASTWNIGGGLYFGNAILSKYPLLDERCLELPGPAEFKHDEGPRCVAYALIDAPCGKVPVFNTHLDYKLHLGHLRIAQVKAVADHIGPVDRDLFPAVLMGDFNAEPDSDEMRFLRGLAAIDDRTVFFNDCWQACNRDSWLGVMHGASPSSPREAERLAAAARGVTYDRANPCALMAREPSRRIDYIYVRGPDSRLRGEPLLARTVFTEPRGESWASDHYGMYAEVQAAAREVR